MSEHVTPIRRRTSEHALRALGLDTSILERELPFGESVRSTKRTYYRIHDPALRFWFRVYSPHRSRWHDYPIQEKQKLLHDHASTVFEDFCRRQFTDASRYWEGDLEFDLVRSERRDDGQQTLIVSEVKWRRLTAVDRRRIEKQLADTWQRSALRHRHPNVLFEVLDSKHPETSAPRIRLTSSSAAVGDSMLVRVCDGAQSSAGVFTN